MLRNGEPGRADGTGRWNDVAGQYAPRREVKRILDAIANAASIRWKASTGHSTG